VSAIEYSGFSVYSIARDELSEIKSRSKLERPACKLALGWASRRKGTVIGSTPEVRGSCLLKDHSPSLRRRWGRN